MFMSVESEPKPLSRSCLQIDSKLESLWDSQHMQLTKVFDVHGLEMLVRKEATQIADVEDRLQAIHPW